jgi:hypothetical protein
MLRSKLNADAERLVGTPGKIRTYDLLLRRHEHLRYVVDATGAIERLRGSKRACSALFDAPFDAPIFILQDCEMSTLSFWQRRAASMSNGDQVRGASQSSHPVNMTKSGSENE